ncbi:F-box protein CPR1-like [Cornus florida]|uniref:F-box protein CPR1-like n=1 Tax=Cornus florida TaxID=4283 RepID=UPI002896A382|nr:F-box protein CPR1-like [Cornus florida]
MSYGAKLPQELVFDVLCRLPVKSLCRFKCVSKSWLTLISDPHFAKTHLNRNNNDNEREQLLLISDHLYSVDCAEASTNKDAVVATKLDCFPINAPEEFEILGSCNGLLLVCDVDFNKYLLNPTTREIRDLPDTPFDHESICGHTILGLGYDSAADDYKVVAIEAREDAEYDDCDKPCCIYTVVSVYSLKSDSWRKIQDVPHYHSYFCTSSLVLVNGCLHWKTVGSHGYSFVIAAFDVTAEKFSELQTPSSLDISGLNLVFYTLGISRGCICLLAPHDNGTQTDFWVMKEYSVTKSWTKLTICEPSIYMMEPLFFLGDEEVLSEKNGHKLVAFNAKGKTSRNIVVHGIPAMFKAGKTYVESLVSPHHICGIDCVRESLIETFGATRERSVAKAKRYRLDLSSSSRSIEASNCIADRFFSDFLDCLKSTWTLETPIHDKALKMLKDPYWRERLRGVLYESERISLLVTGSGCSPSLSERKMISLSQVAPSEGGPSDGNEAFGCVLGENDAYELGRCNCAHCAKMAAAIKRADDAEERGRKLEKMLLVATQKFKEAEEFRNNMEQQMQAFSSSVAAGQSLDLVEEFRNSMNQQIQAFSSYMAKTFPNFDEK